MATQMQLARQGVITEAMKIVAEQEYVNCRIYSRRRSKRVLSPFPATLIIKILFRAVLGAGLTVKVNANIGTSSSYPDPRNRSWQSCRLQLMQV